MVGPLQERHVDIPAGDVLDRRIARFPQRQRAPTIGSDAARNLDHDSIAAALDRDRMIRAWDLDGLWLRFFEFRHGFYDLRADAKSRSGRRLKSDLILR